MVDLRVNSNSSPIILTKTGRRVRRIGPAALSHHQNGVPDG